CSAWAEALGDGKRSRAEGDSCSETNQAWQLEGRSSRHTARGKPEWRVGVVGPMHLFRQVTKPAYTCQFGLASLVHPVEQIANRLHHCVWAVDVERSVRSVFQHAVFAVGNRTSNCEVDRQLDLIQLALRGVGREHCPKWIDAHSGEHNQRDIGHVATAADLVADALEVLRLFHPDAQ